MTSTAAAPASGAMISFLPPRRLNSIGMRTVIGSSAYLRYTSLLDAARLEGQ